MLVCTKTVFGPVPPSVIKNGRVFRIDLGSMTQDTVAEHIRKVMAKLPRKP